MSIEKINTNMVVGVDSYVIDLEKWGISQGIPTKRIENINDTDTVCYATEEYYKAYNNMMGVNNAIAWAYNEGYRYISLPTGEYAICYCHISDLDKDNTIVIDYDNLVFDLNNSTLKVIYDSQKRSPFQKVKVDNEWILSTNPIYGFCGKAIIVRDCKYTTVKNGIIIGDKIDRDFAIQAEKAVEGSYGLCAGGGCKNIDVINNDIAFFMGDGYTCSDSVDKSTVRVGYQMGWQLGTLDSSGILTASTINCVSDYIAVEGNGHYYLQGYGYTQGMTALTNKKYSIYLYDNDHSYITKLTSFVLRSFVTSKLTAYVRLVVEEIAVDENGWQMQLYKGEYGSFITVKNNVIHHNHRGGMTIGVNDMFILNNHFYNNGELYDYENSLPGFEQESGIPFQTRYHINMEDSQGFNINIIGNRFENGNLGIAARGWNYVVSDNTFKNTGAIFYRLHYLVFKNNSFDNGGFGTFEYNDYVRNWNISDNFIDGDFSIRGAAVVNSITNNIINGKVTIQSDVKHFSGNNFKIEKALGYTDYLTLNTVSEIDGCVFDKVTVGTNNSIVLSKGIYSNCRFKNIKIGVKNVVFVNCVIENSSFGFGVSTANDSVKFINCKFYQDDTYTVTSNYATVGENSYLFGITGDGGVYEFVDCEITSSADKHIFFVASHGQNNTDLKLERTTITKTSTNKIGINMFSGTLTFLDSTITSTVSEDSFTPNANLNHTFFNCTFTNVPIVTKSTDYVYSKSDAAIMAKPLIGTSPPTITPSKIGQEFCDTTSKKLYKAFGTSSSADWVAMN